MNTLLVTLPPSGSGVTESLALDQAPLTRITPAGTLFAGCTLSEKSPPFWAACCGRALWPQASNDTNKARTADEHQRREGIFTPSNSQQVSAGNPGETVADRFLTGKSWRDTFVSRQKCVAMITESAGS